MPYTNHITGHIHDVIIKELVTHADPRGFFREIIRVTDPFFGEGFGQWSHARNFQGVIKAWHLHTHQTDWWHCPLGNIKVALYDTRAHSPTHTHLMELYMGDNYPAIVLRIPPGVAHGYKVLSAEAHMLYITSRTYDPADEGRLPHDDPAIGYDWLAGHTIT
ncbi:MAG: dTDP-4-dehydrorhamnose 3,5-epimerase family protein [Caldilineales bacterium]|nr:dTDP-4-dehydrorhamnose 3,5-epimerase family protein [Caldilineales bacterium]